MNCLPDHGIFHGLGWIEEARKINEECFPQYPVNSKRAETEAPVRSGCILGRGFE